MAEEEGTGRNGVFAQSKFVIVRRDLDDERIEALVEQLELHGGEAVLDNYPTERLDLQDVTHIIAETSDFPDYYEAIDLLIPVVKPLWVVSSVGAGKLTHPRKFSPDPKLILSDIVATCADLPQGDREAIAGGILAMGGNYSSRMTSQVTHIVALTMDNEKVEQARKSGLSITVVLPHWFDDCLKLGKKIDEGPYTLPDPEILQSADAKAPMGKPNKHVAGAVIPDPASQTPSLSGRRSLAVFNQKKILLDQDLKISQTLRNVLQGMILASNGKVVEKISEANVLICRYRDGTNYNAASKKVDIGNLAWLYFLIVHDLWTSPYKRLLHYPVPRDPLPGFENLKISLSNYSGEARTYLENLIIATGAECTKTLKQENTHLVTAHKKSEKVAAAEDWNITVVNHLWVEESYARWEKQAETNSRYTHFPQKTNLGEVVGQTPIDRKVIEQKFANHESSGVGTPQGRRKGQAESKALDTSTPAKSNARAPASAKGKGPVTAETPATARVRADGKENVTPSTSGSRKSKAAAAAKMHDMAEDIALFDKERKRKGGVVFGGRRVADEDRIDVSRKRSAEPSEAEVTERKVSSKRQRTDSTSTHMHLLISGYQDWVKKPKKEDEEVKKLRDMGITVVDHPSKATHVAVPRIVRTPKFLVALAFAPKILSTEYVKACLEQDEYLDPDEYELVDKESEKQHGVSLKKVLVNAKANQRQLLQGKIIYCVEKIAGGFETMQAIAEANGATFTPYRGRHLTIPSRRPGSADESEDDPEHEVYLLSNDNAEDKRIWSKFVKTAEDSRRTPQIVIAEWLLSSALKQEVQPLGMYKLEL